MTEERKLVAPGHRLSDEDWARVVARAKEIREGIQAEAGGGASGPGGIVLDMTDLGVASRKYFPVSGIPTQLLVLHSAECPLQGGFAKSLTEWASPPDPAPPQASWQRFVDPIHRVRFIPDELGAWHASEANPLSIGWEQAGYAHFTRDEWLTADGLVQLDMLAIDMAEVAVRDGIPARWLSNAEVRAVLDGGNREIKGFCTHRQIDPETRTDPGDGYPYDILMARIQFYIGNTGDGTIGYQGDTTKESDMYEAADRTRDETTLGTAKMIVEMIDNLAGAINALPGAVLDKQVERADGSAPTSLALMLKYADADRAATIAAIVSALTGAPSGPVDVRALADALAASLAPDLAQELGRRLLGQ